MAELKTKATTASVRTFLSSITPEEKQKDGFVLLEIFEEITGEKAVMWGSSIVGFGKFHYKSQRSAQEGDWPLVGFSPRKQNLTLYIITGDKEESALLRKLGKHTKGVGCLYIKRLSDIDQKILEKLIENAYDFKKKMYR